MELVVLLVAVERTPSSPTSITVARARSRIQPERAAFTTTVARRPTVPSILHRWWLKLEATRLALLSLETAAQVPHVRQQAQTAVTGAKPLVLVTGEAARAAEQLGPTGQEPLERTGRAQPEGRAVQVMLAQAARVVPVAQHQMPARLEAMVLKSARAAWARAVVGAVAVPEHPATTAG